VVTQYEKEEHFVPETEKTVLAVNLAKKLATQAGYGNTEEADIDLTAPESVRLLYPDIETLPALSEETG